MGVLPLRLPQGVNPNTLQIQAGDKIEIVAHSEILKPRSQISVRIKRVSGLIENMVATAAVETQLEVELLQAGGVIPSILHKTIATHASQTKKLINTYA
jgi:aconitate hydratase